MGFSVDIEVCEMHARNVVGTQKFNTWMNLLVPDKQRYCHFLMNVQQTNL